MEERLARPEARSVADAILREVTLPWKSIIRLEIPIRPQKQSGEETEKANPQAEELSRPLLEKELQSLHRTACRRNENRPPDNLQSRDKELRNGAIRLRQACRSTIQTRSGSFRRTTP